MSKELEALDILKNRITTLSLNHKIGNRDIAKLEVKDIVNGIETHVIPVFEQALNKLERLKKFKETFDNYELSKKQDFIAYENWQECEKELTELKRDVKRFMELEEQDTFNSQEEYDEFGELYDKLLKVGKDNNNVKK